MTKSKGSNRDYSSTLFLPETDFAMRGGLPEKEPQLVERWQRMGLYKKLREESSGRPKYVLHDGPPYANGHLHIGHALNKILKDVITRSFQMRGYDSNYVPGWDCHGLPIEWKIEEDYRAKGKNKDDVPINEFRGQCRDFAAKWVKVQTEEFLRLGIEGDFASPYMTMAYDAEAIIARELMKFAVSGQLYRGSKPVMWSVVERTALAEAEIEYREHESDTVWVKFPITKSPAEDLSGAYIMIWTTTPWTLPCNRAISYSDRIDYGLYEVTSAENDFGPQPPERFVVADSLIDEITSKAKVEARRVRSVTPAELLTTETAHPFSGSLDGYDFVVPSLSGDHVTNDAGTGFVHTAPGHGRDDFEIWTSHSKALEERGISSAIPFTVDAAGYYMDGAPGFEGVRVIDDKGKKGDANDKVIQKLIETNNLFARGRMKHDYPHSWRSKKPVIFRNTPQWFISMDKSLDDANSTLRTRALSSIDSTRFVPPTGQNRLRLMIEQRPDWVMSRQRAWGVPLTVFRHIETGEIAPGPNFEHSDSLSAKIERVFCDEGADAWYADDSKERFLGEYVDSLDDWEKVDDILDVWFDSGSTHAFCLERRDDLKWPADLYLEGSDQHRGWFHSSLLESCGTRGRAPYDAVLTHGFLMAEDGRKMSKSGGNQLTPDDVIKKSGADILRLWVVSSDYTEDIRIGPEILKTAVDAYRKLRNSLRWMLGTLSHYDDEEISYSDLPELERLMLHRLHELNGLVQQGYDDFDFKRVFSHLLHFANIDLSAFYFDIRKDALYCDAPSSIRRRASLYVVSRLFDCLTAWFAPMLCFTMEEAWLSRHPRSDSVHLRQFPDIPDSWRADELSAKWDKVRSVRRVVTGALEVEREAKRIGSSLESSPIVHITDSGLLSSLTDLDFAEVCITSGIEITDSAPPDASFTLDDVSGVYVVPRLAEGKKCARSWKVLEDVGSDPDYPDLSSRDASVMRELDGLSTKS